MPQEIVQIAVGQWRVGEVERPQVFALTEAGNIYQYVLPLKGGEEPEWKQLPLIPDVEDGPLS